jgi:hypothetical protein
VKRSVMYGVPGPLVAFRIVNTRIWASDTLECEIDTKL